MPPAWVLLRVQRAHCPTRRPRKGSCAIRNEKDKILDLFPDGRGDRLTFQSAELGRLDFQRCWRAHWLRSRTNLRFSSCSRRYWRKSLTRRVWSSLSPPPSAAVSHQKAEDAFVIDTDMVSISQHRDSDKFQTSCEEARKSTESILKVSETRTWTTFYLLVLSFCRIGRTELRECYILLLRLQAPLISGEEETTDWL